MIAHRPVHPFLALLAAAVPALWAQAGDAAIADIGARVTRVRFFEGGLTLPGPRDRQYTARFDSAATRLVYTEIGLAYPPLARAANLRVECSYAGPGGASAGTATVEVQADAGWELSVHAGGTGREPAGSWKPGAYRVECRYGGKVIASGGFEILPAARAAAPPAPKREEPKRQDTRREEPRKEVPATWGGLKARVVAVRFYESPGGTVDQKTRVVTTSFEARTTRFINVELDLEYPKAAKAVDFEVQCRATGPDSTARVAVLKGSVETGWAGSYHTGWWGSRERGLWPEGNYAVSCLQEGAQVAAAEFTVVRSPPAIAALSAVLAGIRFYHGAAERLPVEPRRYSTRFDSRSARWVKTELAFLYPAVPAPAAFTLQCDYTFPDGTIRPARIERRVPAGWTGSVHVLAVGFDQPGHWPPGSYRVRCTSDGREFASGGFEMVDTGVTAGGIQGATLAVFGRKGPIGGAPDRQFTVGQFDSLFAEANVPPRAAGDSTAIRCTAFDPTGAAAQFDMPGAVRGRAVQGSGRLGFEPPFARGNYAVECRIATRVLGVERFEMQGPPERAGLDARLLASALYEGTDQVPDDEAVPDVSFSAARVRSFWLVALFDHPTDTGAGTLSYSCRIAGPRNVVFSDPGPQTLTIGPGDRTVVLRTRFPLAPRQRWVPGKYQLSCQSGGGPLLATTFDLTR